MLRSTWRRPSPNRRQARRARRGGWRGVTGPAVYCKVLQERRRGGKWVRGAAARQIEGIRKRVMQSVVEREGQEMRREENVEKSTLGNLSARPPLAFPWTHGPPHGKSTQQGAREQGSSSVRLRCRSRGEFQRTVTPGRGRWVLGWSAGGSDWLEIKDGAWITTFRAQTLDR
jgi:hypothetical protein